MPNRMRSIHPGEILRSEYLLPLGMSAKTLAGYLKVPANRITEIVAGERAITADTALRLSRALGTTATFWLYCQQDFDLRAERRNKDRAAERQGIPCVMLGRPMMPII